MRISDVFTALATAVAMLSAAAVVAGPPPPDGLAEASVIFELNDAQVKNQTLAGVAVEVREVGGSEVIAAGTTGADGRWSAALAPGTYRVGYSLAGYVPFTSSATEVRGSGQLITVSLSRMLEDTGDVVRQVRIILNWGSDPEQVKDADSHLACPCADPPGHVYYDSKLHEGEGHRVGLDVDDVDWGGPETVTLTDPPPGSYLYWVHDYEAGPGTLGSSDIVVRVVIGDHEAGEFNVFKGVTQRAWRPFKAIEVGADGQVTVVRFTEDEIAEGLDLQVREDLQSPEPPATATPTRAEREAAAASSRSRIFKLVMAALVAIVIIRFLRRLRCSGR